MRKKTHLYNLIRACAEIPAGFTEFNDPCLSRPQTSGRTNVHYLVFHLTLADSIICYVVLPMETLWRLTIEWHAGNLACKILMMFRTGGFILSSAILVVISIDRSVSFTSIQ